MITSLLVSLLLTEVVELPLGALLGLRDRDGVLTVFLMNLVTNPPVVYLTLLCRRLWPWAGVPVVIVCEAVAAVVETLLLHRCGGLSWRRSVVMALILNGASYGIGCLI